MTSDEDLDACFRVNEPKQSLNVRLGLGKQNIWQENLDVKGVVRINFEAGGMGLRMSSVEVFHLINERIQGFGYAS